MKSKYIVKHAYWKTSRQDVFNTHLFSNTALHEYNYFTIQNLFVSLIDRL